MSEIKGFEFHFNPLTCGLGIQVDLSSDFPGLLNIDLLCFNISIQKWQYWKKYWRQDAKGN